MFIRLARKLVATLVLLVVILLGTTYFLLRSNSFVVSYLLPFVSKQIDIPISAEHADLQPFSGLSLTAARYNCPGTGESCEGDASVSVKATSLAVTYDFWELLSGRVHVTSLRGDGVKVSIKESGVAPDPVGDIEVEDVDADNEPKEKPTSSFIVIDDARIEHGSVEFVQGEDRYQLDDIVLNVPHGESHGDSSITLSTVATSQSQGLNLKREGIDAAVSLKRADLFAPAEIEVDLSLGSGAVKSLEIDGKLLFTEHPYGLQKVELNKASLRHTVLNAFHLPEIPIKDFHYEIDGHYTFSTPAQAYVQLKFNKHLFVGEAGYDLQGSRFDSKLSIHPDRLSVESGSADVKANGAELLRGTFSSEIAFDTSKHVSTIHAKIASADFDKIEALSESVAATPTPAAGESTAAVPAERASDESEAPGTPVHLPLLKASVLVEKSVFQKIPMSNLALELDIPSDRTILKAEVRGAFDGEGTFSMHGSGSLDHSLKVKAVANNVNVLPFAALVQDEGDLLEGTLTSLDLDISASPSDVRKTLTGYVNTRLTNFTVPSTLQGQVPFNILFLPLDALITVFGGTLNAMLPASVSSVSDAIRQTLDEAGRLGLKKGAIDVAFDNGKISCRNVDFTTKNLPDFTFKGSVDRDDGLDLTVFIALLKLNVPLPVVGSLSSPLPDVVYLGPEIVRGLGLSIGNLAGFSGSDEEPTVPEGVAQAPEAGTKQL